MKKKKQWLLLLSCLILIVALLGLAGCGNEASGTEDETSTVSEAEKDADGTDTMQIYDLRVQGLKAPIGLDTEQPSLSWKLESDIQNQTQTAYRIVVSSTEEKLVAGDYDLWDSGKVESDANTGISYEGEALSSMQSVWWKVKVWDKDGNESNFSETSSWEMGLLEESDWQAVWITRSEESVIDKLLNLDENTAATTNLLTDEVGTTDTRYLRISVSESGPAALGEYNDTGLNGLIYRVQIMEIHFYCEGELVETGDSVTATASSNFNWGTQWGLKYLFDGDTNTGYTSAAVASPKYDTPVELTIDFGKTITFDTVEIVCRTDTSSTEESVCANYPKVYTWQISADGETYTNVSSEITMETAPTIPSSGDYSDYAPILSKEFTTDGAKEIASARFYISGLGLYEAYVNGSVLGEGTYFNPGESDVRETVYYATYDITDLLNTDSDTDCENAVTILLGNGQYTNYSIHRQSGRYYKTDDARSESETEGEYGEVKALAQVVITYTDGTIEVIGTDDTWSFVESPITENSWYGGEDYDATLLIEGWNDISPEIPRSEWGNASLVIENIPTGTLTAREFEPIGIIESDTIESEDITVTLLSEEDGMCTYLVDMGRNGAGFPEITVNTATAGLKITMYPAEVSDMTGYNGHINQASCTQSDSDNGNLIYDTYSTDDSGVQTWHPTFCYHGYRYLEVVVSSEITLSSENFKGYILRTENDKNGSFACSDETLNTINLLTERSIESNMYSVFTDCPQIEKLGWTETAHLMFYSMSQTYDLRSWIPKLLQNMADSQYDSGLLSAIAPEYYKIGTLYEDLNWNGSLIFTAWEYYEVYKDATIFTDELYETMDSYMDYLDNNVARDYLIYSGQMGEWGEMTDYGTTPVVLVESTAYYRLANCMANIADLMENDADVMRYKTLAANIKTAFHENTTCYNDEYLYGNGTQSSYGCVLYSGIYLDENEDEAVSRLVAAIEDADYHLTSGEVGLKQVFSALATHGQNEIVYKMIMNDTMPSYKYFVERGLTTLPEYWNFEDLWGSVARSLNHAMMGHVKEWFTRYLVGVDPVSAGYDDVVIKPAIVDEITYASGVVDTIHGTISVDWSYDNDGSFTMTVDIPVGVSAQIYIPVTETGSGILCDGENVQNEISVDGGYYVVSDTFGSGTYTFTIR